MAERDGCHTGSLPSSICVDIEGPRRTPQSADGAKNLLSTVSYIVAEEHNAPDLYRSVLNGPWVHELMVTNYAGYRVRTEYKGLTIAVGLADCVRRGTREVEGREARVVPGSKAVVCIGRV
jgi:hypothetical protein